MVDKNQRLPGQPGTQPPPVEEDDDGFEVVEQLNLDDCPVYQVQGKKVVLDEDLAALFEVETRILIRTVRREIQRFPIDFLFKLTSEEYRSLQRQTPEDVTFARNKSTPYAFTEEGLVMAAQVLNSARAIQANLEIVRNFVRLSKLCGRNIDLSEQIENMEMKYDNQFGKIFKALEVMQSTAKVPMDRRIGFYTGPNK